MSTDASTRGSTKEFVTFDIAGRLFGAEVSAVHDVFSVNALTPVPLARPDIAGLLNLRGRIVTVIDARRRLGLPAQSTSGSRIAIGLDQDGVSYGLAVDAVGEVLALSDSQFEENPVNLDDAWRDVSRGVYRLERGLLIALDISRMLDAPGSEAVRQAA